MQTSLARNSHGGEWDNKEVVSRTAKLRAERATLLGYANHAAYQLEDQTAKDVPTVNKLLADLAPAAVANAKREGADMQAIIDQEKGGFPLAAWDWDFYSEKVRKARYAFDESQLKPYFEFGHALHGMFSNVKYPRFGGTNVPRDFVEYPSQVNEMWAIWPEVLKNYAKHYKNGALMPAELLDKMLAAQKFNQGFKTTEYLA